MVSPVVDSPDPVVGREGMVSLQDSWYERTASATPTLSTSSTRVDWIEKPRLDEDEASSDAPPPPSEESAPTTGEGF